MQWRTDHTGVRDSYFVDKETETVQVVGATQSRQSADLPRALELTTERRFPIKKKRHATIMSIRTTRREGGGMGGWGDGLLRSE